MAQAGKRAVNFDHQLTTETIEQAHPVEAVCVDPGVTVRAVLQLMKERNDGSVLITRDDKLVGIFTERDALRIMAEGADLEIPIEQVMVADPVTLSASDTVGKAIAKMSIGGYRRLPIVGESGGVIGVLKVSGILRYLVEHFPDVVYTLPPKPHHRTATREGA